jgi:sugar O-acyltransferase (sialic acid O-acetyltransferase NeuD family)
VENIAVTIPAASGETVFWLPALYVQEGQPVQQGQALARVEAQGGPGPGETLVSPAEGYIVGLHAGAGQVAHPGQILCYICTQPTVGASKAGLRITTPGSGGLDPTALIIFGGGGHGKSVIDLVQAMGVYRIVGLFDDGLPQGSEVLGVPVLGGAKDLPEWHDRGIHLAANAVGGIGNVSVRLKIFDILKRAGFAFPALVHPSAVIERSAALEAGVQILPQAYVGSAARVGFGSVLNAGAIVSHDCVLGEVVNLSPGATLAGNVRVENHAQIGMRATVNMQITIGERALLGNGCTVKADVPPGTRVRAGTIWPAIKTN